MQHKDKFIGKIVFKNYRIKKKLGEGSFGTVYTISNIKTNDFYAAKLVSNVIYKINYLKILGETGQKK
jgi:serine/threonine protein kinase